jgi:AcrR family transcriptional regulator
MKKAKNRDRILVASVELFNQSGVVAVTTNHIADHLTISPGNLYFHFRNKEEIIRELFEQMTKETYEAWKPNPQTGAYASPLELIERSFEVYWNYRFFHREMYHLRRKDPVLARKWKSHLAKSLRILQAHYASWVKTGIMRKVADPREMQMIADLVMITSSSFLQFFESAEKPAGKKTLRNGSNHLLRLLLPYHADPSHPQIIDRLRAN